MNADRIVLKAYETYKNNFFLISIGILLSGVVAIVLGYIGKFLGPFDMTVALLVTSFFIAGVYLASRSAEDVPSNQEGVKIIARYILAYSILVLFLTAALLAPYPFNVLIDLAVISVLWLGVPILAELGFKEGCRKIKEYLKKAPFSYVGLNLFFVFSLVALLSIAVNPVLAVLSFIAVVFLYLPVYYLTAYYLARSAPRR